MLTVAVKKVKSKYEFDVSGDKTHKARIDPYSAVQVKKLAKAVGVTEQAIHQWMAGCDGGTTSFQVESEVTSPERFSVFARDILETNADAKEFSDADPLPALQSALAAGKELVYWKDATVLCCNDIDYHSVGYDRRHDLEFLHKVIDKLQPRPALAWVSKGRGVHLIYTAANGFTAEEYAALASINWKELDPQATCELKTSTRVPNNPVWTYAQSLNLESALRYVSSSVVPENVSVYLESVGMSQGRTYEHSSCPVAPDLSSHGSPVLAGDHGIFCHKCQSAGVCFGSRKPGFFPYSKLLHCGSSNVLHGMVKGLVHFAHASRILAERTQLSDQINELAYKTLLKLIHGPDDPRIPAVFIAGKNLLRVNNTWETTKRENYSKEIGGILKTLPAVRYVDAKGDVKIDDAKLTMFKEGIDLSQYGYANLTPITGVRLYSHYMDVPDTYSYVVDSLKNVVPPEFKPKYVPWTAASLEAAWKLVETILPGVVRNNLILLICGKGVCESGVGMPPIIAQTGPTRSGKSTYARLAGSICGDYATAIAYTTNQERLHQAIHRGFQDGSFAVINEVWKTAAKEKVSAVHATDFCLTVGSGLVSHKLYVGPVSLGKTGVHILTDLVIPYDVRADRQLGRRIIHAPLLRQVDWEKSLTDYGITDPSKFRQANKAIADACNQILSSIIDTYFISPMTFKDIAAKLGYSTILEEAERYDSDSILRQFFGAVCDAEEAGAGVSSRVVGTGWKHIQKGRGDKLEELWTALCDNEFSAFHESRRCAEVEWRKVLKKESDVSFELVRYNGQNVLVRFKNGDTFNGSIA